LAHGKTIAIEKIANVDMNMKINSKFKEKNHGI
jgi:hypothetical protein